MTEGRFCYYITGLRDSNGYIPSVVYENEAGYRPMIGWGKGSRPWYWGKTRDKAEEVCRAKNEEMGISEEDEKVIVTTNMAIQSAQEAEAGQRPEA